MPRTGPFRYETLLRIRKRQEDVRALGLATALRDIRLAEQQRDSLAAEQQAALGRWSEELRHDLDAGAARSYQQYERHLAHLIDERDAALHRLEDVAAARRAELLEASKRKRIVVKLKERKNAAHAREMLRLAQRASDEAATNRATLTRQQEALAPESSEPRE